MVKICDSHCSSDALHVMQYSTSCIFGPDSLKTMLFILQFGNVLLKIIKQCL